VDLPKNIIEEAGGHISFIMSTKDGHILSECLLYWTKIYVVFFIQTCIFPLSTWKNRPWEASSRSIS